MTKYDDVFLKGEIPFLNEKLKLRIQKEYLTYILAKEFPLSFSDHLCIFYEWQDETLMSVIIMLYTSFVILAIYLLWVPYYFTLVKFFQVGLFLLGGSVVIILLTFFYSKKNQEIVVLGPPNFYFADTFNLEQKEPKVEIVPPFFQPKNKNLPNYKKVFLFLQIYPCYFAVLEAYPEIVQNYILLYYSKSYPISKFSRFQSLFFKNQTFAGLIYLLTLFLLIFIAFWVLDQFGNPF